MEMSHRVTLRGVTSCAIDGCGRKPKSLGYCGLHYHRTRRGKLGPALASPIRTYSIHNEVSWSSAHNRITIAWGPARLYDCVACASPAQDWAYDGTDPSELFGRHASNKNAMHFYSRYPEFYMPMCKKCHMRRDKGLGASELREYREWKHRTGRTLADIA